MAKNYLMRMQLVEVVKWSSLDQDRFSLNRIHLGEPSNHILSKRSEH